MAKEPLEGHSVIITGSGAGLGRAYAEYAARCGASVVVNDITPSAVEQTVEAIRSAGGTAEGVVADVSSPDGCDQVVDMCLAAFHRIDGLVNNAASYYAAPLLDEHPDDMRRLIAVNLLGPMWLSRRSALAMTDQGSGSIVNVTSGAAQGIASMGSYGASKAGVLSLTYTWALELKASGVRVNALSPRANTAMAMGTEEARQFTVEGRTPDKIAPVVAYLLSPLSARISGVVMRFDGETASLLGLPFVHSHLSRDGLWSVEDVAGFFNQLPDDALGEASMQAMLDHGQ